MADIKLKAIAVDDELHCLETLEWELSRSCPEVEIIKCITNEKEVIEIIPKYNFDILFMDIHLQSSSGVELVKQLQPLNCEVVFVTAYDKYAIEAFELAAVHYLLKPVHGQKLRSAIDRIIEKRKGIGNKTIDRLVAALSNSNQLEKRIPFGVQSGIEFVLPDDIIYVSGENNYSVLHFADKRKLVISKTLSNVESTLSEFSFLRVHKSYLLNLKHIVRYVKKDGGYIEVTGGDQLSVSRSKKGIINKLFLES